MRNALLGASIQEFDVATTAIPQEVIRRVTAAGFKPVPTGIEHGTITVVIDGRPFEVTTLREDVETFGRHANVRFGRDWKADAERRDFTMNALSVTADGVVHDYVGGLADLEARRVRFIGHAEKRIAEDYLRILRFFRFHAAYGHGAIDADGLHACIATRAGLDQLSRERVRTELLKLLVATNAVPTLAVMAESGLLVPVLGGVPDLAGIANMAKVEAAAGVQADPVQRLGALAVRVAEDAERLCSACGFPMPSTRASPRWARPGGGFRRPAKRKRARCSIVWGRRVLSIACCWRGRAHGRKASMTRPGVRWRACHHAGSCRCFRSRPPISPSAA